MSKNKEITREKYQKMVETQEPIHYRKACIQ